MHILFLGHCIMYIILHVTITLEIIIIKRMQICLFLVFRRMSQVSTVQHADKLVRFNNVCAKLAHSSKIIVLGKFANQVSIPFFPLQPC